MNKARYACEFLIKYRVMIEDALTVEAAKEQALRFMAQHHPQHLLTSIERMPDEIAPVQT